MHKGHNGSVCTFKLTSTEPGTDLVERDESFLTHVEQGGDGGITVQGESTMSGQFN